MNSVAKFLLTVGLLICSPMGCSSGDYGTGVNDQPDPGENASAGTDANE